MATAGRMLLPPTPCMASQLALLGRAIKDNADQCATPFFQLPQARRLCRSTPSWRACMHACGALSPPRQAPPASLPAQVQAVLRGVATRLSSTLSSALYMGAGIEPQVGALPVAACGGDISPALFVGSGATPRAALRCCLLLVQASLPASLDPCIAVGTWAATCALLLTVLVLVAAEFHARTRFARRHAHRLDSTEAHLATDEQSSPWFTWSALALCYAFLCLLVWQVLVALLGSGRLPGLFASGGLQSHMIASDAPVAG